MCFWWYQVVESILVVVVYRPLKKSRPEPLLQHWQEFRMIFFDISEDVSQAVHLKDVLVDVGFDYSESTNKVKLYYSIFFTFSESVTLPDRSQKKLEKT